MPTLHLLNQEGPDFPQPREIAGGKMESGYWLLSGERAGAMIGHRVFFHRRKTEPPFLAGTVTGFRREKFPPPERGNPRTRTVLIFAPDGMTGSNGWTPAGVKFIP